MTQFLRVNDYVVNIDCIQDFWPEFGDTTRVRLTNGTTKQIEVPFCDFIKLLKGEWDGQN